MLPTLIVLLVIVVIIAGIGFSPLYLRWHRQQLQRRFFPPRWLAVVEQALPMYRQLTPQQRKRLQGHIQVFLAEKQFIGCSGLQISEEIQITIAAIACLLLLNERGRYFAKLRSILVYPAPYWVTVTNEVAGGIVEERREVRLGESWSADQVILTWSRIQQDIQHWTDGQNVVLHEFAHQLDEEDGQTQGVPLLPQRADYVVWQQVMTQAYQQLCQDLDRNLPTVMDPYGATNPAEFFAVATETFFEKPDALSTHHPRVYQQLQYYYQLNPLQWRQSHAIID